MAFLSLLKLKGFQQKGKQTHGHGHQCGDCVGGGVIRGLNGDGKNYNKHFLQKKKENHYSKYTGCQHLAGPCQGAILFSLHLEK